MPEPMSDGRLCAIAESSRACPDACAVDAEMLVEEVRRLRSMLPAQYSAGFRDGRESALPLDQQAPVVAGSV